MAVPVLVTIPAKPGKEPRVLELVEWVIGEVKKTEPNVSYYTAHRVDNPETGTTDVLVFFR